MSGQHGGAVESYQGPLPSEIPEKERGDWLLIGRQARAASLSKVSGQWKDQPEAIFAAYWMAHTLGMAVSINVLAKFHNLDGRVEPSAQTRLGLMHAHRHRTRWGRHDDTLAELFVRVYGDEEEQRFSFSAEQARAAGLLDQWVEQYVDTGEKWADSGKPKRRLDRYVIGTSPEPPKWAADLINAGQVKRRDNWFAYREDMLMNRAASRACKFATPEVEMGIEVAAAAPLPPVGAWPGAASGAPAAPRPSIDPGEQLELGGPA